MPKESVLVLLENIIQLSDLFSIQLDYVENSIEIIFKIKKE